jgi:hypothetical protein
MNGTKSWYQSKLIWFGALQFFAGGTDSLLKTEDLPPEVYKWVLMFSGVMTVIMRTWFTTKKIETNSDGN